MDHVTAATMGSTSGADFIFFFFWVACELLFLFFLYTSCVIGSDLFCSSFYLLCKQEFS